jgi:hypothetical protein
LAVAGVADPKNGIITAGLFIGVEDGSFVTAFVAITFNRQRIDPVRLENAQLAECIGDPPIRMCATGETAVFARFKTDGNPWKGEEVVSPRKGGKVDLETPRAIRFAELTAIHEQKKTVGGPIDALEVWKDGSIHWVKRKPNCSRK